MYLVERYQLAESFIAFFTGGASKIPTVNVEQCKEWAPLPPAVRLSLEARAVMLQMSEVQVEGPIGSTDWMIGAGCSGKSEVFFAPFAERPEARVRREARARAICESCDAIVQCRDYARTNRELGFWGGESESERSDAGYAPTTPIIGRKRVAEERARKALKVAS